MKFLSVILTIFMITFYGSAAWGLDQKVLQKFNNISIETSGDQIYDLEANTVTTTGHVTMKLDDVKIEADSLTYYGNQNLTVAKGNVILTKEGMKLTAKKLTYQNVTGMVEASGNAEYTSLTENYNSDTIHFNVNTMVGNVGPFRGVVKSGGKDYFLTGAQAQMDQENTTITPAGLTRCPRKDHPDYIFKSKKMKIKGSVIYMERVTIKVLGVPVMYLPHLTIKQNEQAPKFNVSSNSGDEPDLSSSNNYANAGSTELLSSWVYRIEINSTIPSKIALGREFDLGRYSDRLDVEYNSNGYFSLVDGFGMDWKRFHLDIDGKTDLNADPERELGLTLSRKTFDTGLGKLKVSAFTRMLYSKETEQEYQGVYGGYRLDYQPYKDLSCTYLYLKGLTGSEQEWDQLESDFMIIKNYRLGGNFMFNANIPLTTCYSILYKGSYNFEDSSWTSQILGFTRQVCCVTSGAGWDFAKQQVELRFKLNY